jgi:hypothetical protein
MTDDDNPEIEENTLIITKFRPNDDNPEIEENTLFLQRS